MKKIKVPSDVVKATFILLGKKERFPANIPEIHKSFYKIANVEKYNTLFSDFIFDDTQQYPVSTTIDNALDRLQKSDLLACINPGLDEFEISEKLYNKKDEIDELFDKGDIHLLTEVAEIFKREINAC